jgi:hypothetical protein
MRHSGVNLAQLAAIIPKSHTAWLAKRVDIFLRGHATLDLACNPSILAKPLENGTIEVRSDV